MFYILCRGTFFFTVFANVSCYSGEGDFHILHYVQYGLNGVDKFHLRADHDYRSVGCFLVFLQ